MGHHRERLDQSPVGRARRFRFWADSTCLRLAVSTTAIWGRVCERDIAAASEPENPPYFMVRQMRDLRSYPSRQEGGSHASAHDRHRARRSQLMSGTRHTDSPRTLHRSAKRLEAGRVLQNLQNLRIDLSPESGVAVASLAIASLLIQRDPERPGHLGLRRTSLVEVTRRNSPFRTRSRPAANSGHRAGSRIDSSYAAIIASSALDLPRRPSRALTTFTTWLACSDKSTTARGISSIPKYLEATRRVFLLHLRHSRRIEPLPLRGLFGVVQRLGRAPFSSRHTPAR